MRTRRLPGISLLSMYTPPSLGLWGPPGTLTDPLTRVARLGLVDVICDSYDVISFVSFPKDTLRPIQNWGPSFLTHQGGGFTWYMSPDVHPSAMANWTGMSSRL